MKKAAESMAKGKRLKVVKAAQIPDAGAAKPKIPRNSKFKSMGTKDTELQMQFLLESFGAIGITAEELVSGSGKAKSAAKRIGAAISGIDPQDEIQGCWPFSCSPHMLWPWNSHGERCIHNNPQS